MTSNWQKTVTHRAGPPRQPFAACVELRRWVSEQEFAFVVGPGCARIGSDAPDITAPVAESMMRCFNALEDDADREFLALLAWRVGIDLTVAEDPGNDEVDDALLGFRGALVRVARLSVAAVSDAMASLDEPILDWDRYGVPLVVANEQSAITEGLAELERILAQLAFTVELRRADRAAEPSPGADHATENAPTSLEWNDLHLVFGLRGVKGSLEQLRTTLLTGAPLLGAHVEWLTSLLWHSFRFAAPWYPSTDELAFQLAVAWDGARVIEVPDRALATQPHAAQADVQAPLARLLELAGRYNHKQGFEERRALYRAVVSLLIVRNTSAGSDLAAFDGRNGPLVPRVILSSCFDPLLEEALEAQLRAELDGVQWAYHVILPALTTSILLHGNRTANIHWLIGTNMCGEWSWRVLPSEPGTTEFLGPVIVRLNGDPLRQWPSADAIGGAPDRLQTVEPMIVMSEFQHLSVALNEVQVFDAVSSIGSKKGRFILLGESVGEWSIRQRLFGQAMYLMQKPSLLGDAEDGAGPNLVEAISINRRVDDMRHSLLQWVNIKEYEGDLREVVGQLRTLAGRP